MKAVSLALSMALMLPALALAEKGDKGPSDKAYESASEKASFKREDGKPGKGEKDKQKGHSHDGEHDKQDSDTEGSKYRRTEQEQEQVRDRDREKVQTEQRETSSERVESAGSGGETGTEEKPRAGFWQRLFEQRKEKKAADGN